MLMAQCVTINDPSGGAVVGGEDAGAVDAAVEDSGMAGSAMVAVPDVSVRFHWPMARAARPQFRTMLASQAVA